HHLVAPEWRVRHAPDRIEFRLPRGRHDLIVERIHDRGVACWREAEQSFEHAGQAPISWLAPSVASVASSAKLVYRFSRSVQADPAATEFNRRRPQRGYADKCRLRSPFSSPATRFRFR